MRDFSHRSTQSELIDDISNLDEAEFAESLAGIRQVNRFLGGTSAIMRHLAPMILQQRKPEPVSILDIGTGSADIPEAIALWARREGVVVSITGIDLNEQAVDIARRRLAGFPEIIVNVEDATLLPYPQQSFDFVIASMFLHHFKTIEAAQLLRSFYQITRAAVIINDLRRHPLPYYAIKAIMWLATKNRLLRNDAPLSVLRGFTVEDFAELKSLSGLDEARIYCHFPYRIVLVAQRSN